MLYVHEMLYFYILCSMCSTFYVFYVQCSMFYVLCSIIHSRNDAV